MMDRTLRQSLEREREKDREKEVEQQWEKPRSLPRTVAEFEIKIPEGGTRQGTFIPGLEQENTCSVPSISTNFIIFSMRCARYADHSSDSSSVRKGSPSSVSSTSAVFSLSSSRRFLSFCGVCRRSFASASRDGLVT